MDGTGKEQLCGKINDLPMMDPGMHIIGAGYWVYVPEEIPHSFWNTSETEDLISLCTVTKEGDTDPLALTRGC